VSIPALWVHPAPCLVGTRNYFQGARAAGA
jgi:hypothetical protein